MASYRKKTESLFIHKEDKCASNESDYVCSQYDAGS